MYRRLCVCVWECVNNIKYHLRCGAISAFLTQLLLSGVGGELNVQIANDMIKMWLVLLTVGLSHQIFFKKKQPGLILTWAQGVVKSFT